MSNKITPFFIRRPHVQKEKDGLRSNWAHWQKLVMRCTSSHVTPLPHRLDDYVEYAEALPFITADPTKHRHWVSIRACFDAFQVK